MKIEVLGIDLLGPLLSAVFSMLGILLVFSVRSILDWKLAPWLVPLLSKIPTRGLELKKHAVLKGRWNHEYSTHDRKGSIPLSISEGRSLHQFSSFVYSDFYSDGVEYYMLGRISDGYITGTWGAKKEKINSYLGAFQLKIIDETVLKGTWIGFSKTDGVIRHGDWKWKKVD